MAPAAGNKKNGGNGANGAAAAVGDARFQKVHNDPRFARLNNKKNKLQIDKRFAAVLKDDRFQSVQGKYDKYGRRIDKKENELKKFYRLDDEDDAEDSSDDEEEEEDNASAKPSKGKGKAKAKPEESSTDQDDDESESDPEEGDEKMTRLDYLNRMARGELESASESSDDSADSDEDVEMEEDEDEKEDIPLGEETTRFAVMNCDWSRIRAVDLFALFQSFAPATGAVKDVTIYPSDFGLEKMKEEEQHGPRMLWEGKEKKQQQSESDAKEESVDGSDEEVNGKPNDAHSEDEEEAEIDQDDENDGYDSEDPLGVKQTVTANESDGFDVEKLRKYELQKLKYYYAVVTCDSVKTAATIYENCDQMEYETSANLLDLRFIPDDMEFKNPPKESCQNVQETYKPSIFATQALQQTEVKLTWEEDEDRRMELLTRQAEWKDAHDDDFAAYLASENSSSEDEVDEDDDEQETKEKGAMELEGNEKTRAERKKAAKLKKIKNRYRKMLLGSDVEDSDGSGSDNDEAMGGTGSSDEDSADEKPEGMDTDSDDEDAGDGEASGNMEMSFTPGVGDILKAKKQKELEANETPFERYVREKKQEKNKKRHEKRAQQKEQAREQKAVLKKRGKAAPEQLKALREAIDDNEDAENDSDDGDRNFDMKKIAQSEKAKKLKGKRKNKELNKLTKKSGLQEGFEFDAADPRFGKLYEKGSQFQLDPTDPKFKKTEATQAIFQERRKRQSQPQDKTKKDDHVHSRTQEEGPESEKKEDSKNELKAIVENLKRKSAPVGNNMKKRAMKPFKKTKF